jgi:hypothetical protein
MARRSSEKAPMRRFTPPAASRAIGNYLFAIAGKSRNLEEARI